MSSIPEGRTKRAKSRSAWPIRRYSLDAEPSENLSASTTAGERLAMMWELAFQAWSLTGRPLPDYERQRAPGRLIRAAR